ncbi:DNA topoisomerase (ATP-hydrolyzing) [Actinokineospora cianjurensis]|uniref:DNA topoisomerase (ATP-hydrolyzing) n=1 Tax=Actinokineospora cianjurensis TaxID=585224 RepID=A0A421AUT4_9PSEU|nr:DNA topoisomerase (ATP-hydrolyzing) [Actinokineospora cianjurensis]RLK53821.1 DNA gyrase subunit A [Actinokineospora cianjurensis]
MARRKAPATKVDPSAFDQAGATVVDNPVRTEIEDSYLEYAYSVIHSRALPDARDGLKPVHRRILFSMHEQGYRPTHAYVKSSRVVGDCFVRGALVSTPSGLRPIEGIELGEQVLDPAGRPVPVTAVYENPVSDLVRVTWTSGHTMLVTPGQRFRVSSGSGHEWVEARDLAGRRTIAGAGASEVTASDNGYAYVLGVIAASGSVTAAGELRVESLEAGPVDHVHGWAIGAGLDTRRDKREARTPTQRDRHILTFADAGLLATRDTVPAVVLADRAAWLPYLAGLLDGAGHVRRGRGQIAGLARPELLRQVWCLLADLGIPADQWDRSGLRGITVSGGAAATLAALLLPWVRSCDKHTGLAHFAAPAESSAPLSSTVASVEPVDGDTTYDIQVGSDEHAFVVEGLVVHNCMGKYHPHGDSAIYDAMVRLAQDFSLNAPLVDGHGNFGSPDDGPAASRYTEARMSNEAMLLVGELGEDTVDFRPNYDGSLLEPVVLPAAFPNLLVNGTSGIAVGMATNMIPHNLGEVVAAARYLITHPEADLDKLMEFIPGPDLPTGGMLLGLDEVRKAYETGRGVVRMRAKVEIGHLEGSRRQAITVTELPYQVGSEKIIEKITEEVNKSKRLTGIADVKDLTDRENGTRLVIECKVGVNPQALLADLYRLTPMEQSFGINNLVLVEGQPRTLGLKALLEVFLKHRYEVVTRRTRYRKRKREERLHLVEGLLLALVDIDKVIRLIRGSDDAAAAKAGLMGRFTLSEVQATYILDTPLRRLTKFDKLELEDEQEKLRGEIEELAKILDDDKVLRRVVSTELGKVARDLTAERRTSLIDGDLKEVLAASKPAGPLEVADDPCQVVLSATGLVARTAAESEEASEGRSRKGRARHDAVAALVHSTARGQVLLVTNRGRAFKTDVLPLPVLPEQSGTVSVSGGMAASELVSLEKGERVIGIAPLGDQAAGSPGLALGTRQGVVKVCAPEWPVRSDEFEVITLKDGDEVVGATWLTDGSETLAFVTGDAALLRYAASLVRPQGLRGGGMAGINVPADGKALFFGAIRIDDPDHGEPQVVTSTGQSVKVTPFAEYPAKGRATGGVRAHRFLKGETALVLAWIGPRPAGSTKTGSAVELPEPDPRRDGSGHAHPGPDVIGHLVERA